MNKILVEVSVGELLDKISILEIKKEKISDLESLKIINTEYLIAKDFNYLINTSQYHKYANLNKESFQHGGISLDEIILSLFIIS